MFKRRRMLAIFLILTIFITFSFTEKTQAAPMVNNINRIYGKDRFQTSIAVANQQLQGKLAQNVVVASGYSFPDALAVSPLAAKLNAPIILVGLGVQDSKSSLNFIKGHTDSEGTITIVGGVGAVSLEIEQWLQNAGFKVVRLGGSDRFATNSIIVQNLSVAHGTPVFVVNGYDFPDALSVASIAANKQWPILLSDPDHMPDFLQSFLKTDNPSNVYMVGGDAVLRGPLYRQLQQIGINKGVITFSGRDRFDTASQVLSAFFWDKTPPLYVANGLEFADALSGSILAAQNNAPIVLIDPNATELPTRVQDYLGRMTNPNKSLQVNVFGGEGAVPNSIGTQITYALKKIVNLPSPQTNDTPSVLATNIANKAVSADAFWERSSDNCYLSVQVYDPQDPNHYHTTSLIDMMKPDQPLYLSASSGGSENTTWQWFVNSPDATITDAKNADKSKSIFTASKPGVYTVQAKCGDEYSVPLVLLIGADQIVSQKLFVNSSGDDSAIIKNIASNILAASPDLNTGVAAISNFVSAKIKYAWIEFLNGTITSRSALDTLQSQTGVCQDYANLTVTLLKAVGIPSQIVSGTAFGTYSGLHAWIQYWNGKEWIPDDPTWNRLGIIDDDGNINDIGITNGYMTSTWGFRGTRILSR